MQTSTQLSREIMLRAEKLRRVYGGDPDVLPLSIWTSLYRREIRKDIKFDLVDHKYLREMYNVQARELVVCKASQVRVSELMISYALHAAAERHATVIYLFPTDGDISDFSSARFGPAIEASEYLSGIVVHGRGRGADRVKLKRVGDSFLYLRGAYVNKKGNASQLKSIAGDIVIFDEVDEMDRRAIPIAVHRTDDSAIREHRYVSTPTWPGAGISSLWEESDQREWFLRCDACGNRQDILIGDVVYEWDSLERPLLWHGKGTEEAWPACRRCGARIDRLADGEWVPRYPGRAMVGYHPTKLFAPMTPLIDVVMSLHTVNETDKKEAFNQHLGLAYSPRGDRLTEEELDAARRPYLHGRADSAFAGVDVGSVLNVVIRTKASDGSLRQAYAGTCSWADLESTLSRYGARVVVIDALPETEQARTFQKNSAMSVYLAYYPTSRAGTRDVEYLKTDKAKGIVQIDRTRGLDSVLAGIRDGTITLPANASDISEYYKQMSAVVPVMHVTDQASVKIYAQDGPDHYAHAENYCLAASNLMPARLSDQSRIKKKGGSWN